MTGCDGDHPESAPHQHDQDAHPGGAGGHGHGVTASSDGSLITIALALIVGFLVFEVIMAFAGHSLALLADAGHMLTDAGALSASLLAIRLARRPASGVWTFGFKRAEVLSAQTNGVTLLVITDLYGFIGTLVAGIVIITTGFERADAIASLIVVGLMLRADCHQVRRDLEQLLCERFSLDHTTLQVDHAPGELLTIDGGAR